LQLSTRRWTCIVSGVLWTFQYFSSVISIQSQPSGFGHCSVFFAFL
ncbi:5832_t:CDS:2, partial [Dentiscutata heterogama]